MSPSGFCFFGRGSDSGDALKNRSFLRLYQCFSFSSFLSNSSSHLISIISRHRRIVNDPLYPLITPSSRTILLSSCTLTVSDYIQSTICKTSSVFCFVSSFLSAFCKFQPESWKEKKRKHPGYSLPLDTVRLPGEDLLLLLFLSCLVSVFFLHLLLHLHHSNPENNR